MYNILKYLLSYLENFAGCYKTGVRITTNAVAEVIETPSYQDCQSKCSQKSECNFFNWYILVGGKMTCELKPGDKIQEECNYSTTSGPKNCL